jgi:ABC-type anion transport system duplicated permease subunit
VCVCVWSREHSPPHEHAVGAWEYADSASHSVCLLSTCVCACVCVCVWCPAVWSAPVDAPEKPAWTPLHSFLKVCVCVCLCVCVCVCMCVYVCMYVCVYIQQTTCVARLERVHDAPPPLPLISNPNRMRPAARTTGGGW